MKENIYIRFGRKFRKIGRNEKIEEGAMHYFCGGELWPIKSPDTVGDIPASFSDEREFYNPIPENE
jgi:hypothetical protein